MIGFGTGSEVVRHAGADDLRLPESARFACWPRSWRCSAGRDNTNTNTSARPVYNRLYWNFTSGRRGVRLRPGLQHHRPGSRRQPERVRRPDPLPAGTRRRLGPLPDGDDDLLRPAAASVLHLAAAAGGGKCRGCAGSGRLPRRTQVRQGRRDEGARRRRDRQSHLPLELRRGSGRTVAGLQRHRPRSRLGPLGMGQARRAGGLLRLGGGQRDPAGRGSRIRSTSASRRWTGSRSRSWPRSSPRRKASR